MRSLPSRKTPKTITIKLGVNQWRARRAACAVYPYKSRGSAFLSRPAAAAAAAAAIPAANNASFIYERRNGPGTVERYRVTAFNSTVRSSIRPRTLAATIARARVVPFVPHRPNVIGALPALSLNGRKQIVTIIPYGDPARWIRLRFPSVKARGGSSLLREDINSYFPAESFSNVLANQSYRNTTLTLRAIGRLINNNGTRVGTFVIYLR